MRVEIMYVIMWPMALACFSVVIVSYAKKYDKRIAAIYGVVMAVVVMFTAIEANGSKEMDGLKDVRVFLQMLFQYLGFTGAVILLSLCVVAEKRPIKVRRWLRFSYLCMGISLLMKSMLVYETNPGIRIWRWDGQANMLLVLWLLLCISLHGKLSYTKKTCILPVAIIVIWKDMSARISLVAVLILVMAALVVAIKMNLVSYPSLHFLNGEETFGKDKNKDAMYLFRMATAIYCLFLLLASVCAGVIGVGLPNVAYNTAATVYVLAIVLALLIRQEQLNYLSYVLGVVWDIVLVLVVKVLYPGVGILILLVFGICLLKVLFFLIQIKKTWKSGIEVSHCAVLCMTLAGILCCGLREIHMASARGFVYLFFAGAAAALAYTLYCMTRRLV